MKHFTDTDVKVSGDYVRIYCDREDLLYLPTEWQKRGLQETASGYGKNLNTGLKISFNGKLYRIYCTIYSNAGTSFFTAKGRKIVVF